MNSDQKKMLIDGLAIVFLCAMLSVFFEVGHERTIGRLGDDLLARRHLPNGQAFAWSLAVGLMFGVPLALAAQLGSWPQLTVRELAIPIVCVVVAMMLFSFYVGVSSYQTEYFDALEWSQGASSREAKKQAAFIAEGRARP